MRLLYFLALLGLLFAVTGARGAALPGFAVAAAVRGDVARYTAEGEGPHEVKTGSVLAPGDRLETGPDSRLQVLLTDGSVFTLGASTEFVLEKFLYDVDTGQGAIEAAVPSGSFKLITGRVNETQPGSVTVKMQSSLLAVRGTMVAGDSGAEDGDTAVLLGPGARRDSADQKGSFELGALPGDPVEGEVSVLVYRAGYAVTMSPDGSIFGPFQMTGREFGQLTAGFLGGSQSGGPPQGTANDAAAAQADPVGASGDPGVDVTGGREAPGLSRGLSATTLVEIGNEPECGAGSSDGVCGPDDLNEAGNALLVELGLLDENGVPGGGNVTTLDDLEEIGNEGRGPALQGRFVEEEIAMAGGGSFDLVFEFGQNAPAVIDLLGFVDIDTTQIENGELSYSAALDGPPGFDELMLSSDDGTLTGREGCVADGDCAGRITVLNAGQGSVAKFFQLELTTPDDEFSGTVVRPGGNNKFPQDDPADID